MTLLLRHPAPPRPDSPWCVSIWSSHLGGACGAPHKTSSEFPPLSSEAPPSPQIPWPWLDRRDACALGK